MDLRETHAAVPTRRDAQVGVALLEDCDLVALGLRAMLEPYAHRVVLLGEEQVLGGLVTADVVLVDPFTEEGRVRSPRLWSAVDAPVVLYTWHRPEQLDGLSRAPGVVGHVAKHAPVAELVESLETFAAAGPAPAHQGAEARTPALSRREHQVLDLVALGLSNQEIAERLFLSVNTVKTYIRTAYAKVGVTTRSQAVAWTLLHGD